MAYQTPLVFILLVHSASGLRASTEAKVEADTNVAAGIENDGTFREANASSRTGKGSPCAKKDTGICHAVRICEKALMAPCTGDGISEGYCGVFKKARQATEPCGGDTGICHNTMAHMWENANKFVLTDQELNEQIREEAKHMTSVVERLTEMNPYHAMEAIMREQFLKCICVHRGKPDFAPMLGIKLGEEAYVNKCYEGSQGIAEGKEDGKLRYLTNREDTDLWKGDEYIGPLWCEFGFQMPSWRKEKDKTKPTILNKYKENENEYPQNLLKDHCSGTIRVKDWDGEKKEFDLKGELPNLRAKSVSAAAVKMPLVYTDDQVENSKGASKKRWRKVMKGVTGQGRDVQKCGDNEWKPRAYDAIKKMHRSCCFSRPEKTTDEALAENPHNAWMKGCMQD